MTLTGVWSRTSRLLCGRLQHVPLGVGRSVCCRCFGAVGSPAIPGQKRVPPAQLTGCVRSTPRHINARISLPDRHFLETRTFFWSAVSVVRTLSSKARDVDADNAAPTSDDSLPQTEADWDHPAVRSEDVILNTDPELRSLLCEIASDFGRSEPAGGDGKPSTVEPGFVAVTTEDQEMGVDTEKDFPRKESESDSAETCHSAETTSMTRDGETSNVFSVDSIVDILRAENALDICVICVPPEKEYVDYFVVVTGRSSRHLSAMTQRINQLYKRKKGKEDPFLNIEGKLTRDWMCLDFGNVVVHFMLAETRAVYDLESLWTLGREYDDHMTLWEEQQALLFVPEADPEPQSTTAEISPDTQP